MSEPSTNLTRDADQQVLLKMTDADLLTNCRLNSYYRNTVCNEDLFRNRLLLKYPDTLRWKPEVMKYKAWYLRIVYYVAKLKEDFNYNYTGGNPKTQLKIFRDFNLFINKEGNLYENAMLMESATKGELTLVKYLVEQGANIHTDTDMAVRMASKFGHLDVVKYLVEQGADISAIDDEAFLIASENGHLEVVKYLIEQGANINADDGYALKWASRKGYLEMVKYLVEQKANIRDFGDFALVWAAMSGHLEVVKYLVELGANIHAFNDFALNKAYKNGHLEVVEYLKSLP